MNEFHPEGAILNTLENRLAKQSLAALEKAMEEERILEAVPNLCDPDFNLHFEFAGIPAVLPKEEVALIENGGEVRDIAVITRVGKPCAFLVDRIECEPELRIFLSRKKAQEKCLSEYLDHLKIGDILPAKITHFEHFGAFCDIGCGIASLLSIDCISISRILHPSDRFFVGQEILCAVKARDEVRLGNLGRISLTHKELLGTWQENADRFRIGQTVVGVIRSIESYGIFIELAPNLAGLAEWRDDVKVGDGCSVYIKNIIPKKRKIKLVIIDTFRHNREHAQSRYFITEGSIQSFSYTAEGA